MPTQGPLRNGIMEHNKAWTNHFRAYLSCVQERETWHTQLSYQEQRRACVDSLKLCMLVRLVHLHYRCECIHDMRNRLGLACYYSIGACLSQCIDASSIYWWRIVFSVLPHGFTRMFSDNSTGVGVTKPIFSVPLFSTFSVIVKTSVSYWISRLYLAGVAAAQLRQHLSNMNVIQGI